MATVPSVSTFTVGQKLTAALLNAIKTFLDFLFNVPRCQVYDATGQATVSGTAKLVTFDTEAYDTDSMHDPSTNPSRVIFNTVGLWHIEPFARFPANATGYRRLQVRLNSGGSSAGGSALVTHTQAPSPGLETGLIRPFEYQVTAAGDYIELFLTQLSGGAMTSDSGARITGISARLVAVS